MEYKQFKTELAGRELKVEVGKLAQQANASVVVTYGGTTVLVTCVMGSEPKTTDYLPLSVEFEERLYAAGKMKGSRFMKREGRPTEEATLTGRMIDRIIRPLFNQKIRNEIQIVPTVLCFDKENDADIPALLAVSLALSISNIPWNGPVAALRIGWIPEEGENKWLLNPTYALRERSVVDLIVAGKEGRVNMLEAGAKEVKEETMLSAIGFADSYLKKLIQFQNEIVEEIGGKKIEPDLAPEAAVDLIQAAKNWLAGKLDKAFFEVKKQQRNDALSDLRKQLLEALIGPEADEAAKRDKTQQICEIFDQAVNDILRQSVLKDGKRPDGRQLDEVRPLQCEVAYLGRVHGSGLFQRGETQVLSVVTLAGPSEAQLLDGMELEGEKRYLHHYNFPPYCTGETGRLGNPGRREIGHGALAEKALIPLIPDKEAFPYVIRVVSEVLSSNGSSSMASACGSSLALMDAGVPIKSPAAGIAMGLVMESLDNYRVLTDIQGPEDHHGDMDCKIAGTAAGMTAMQMDVKIEGVSLEILKKVFEQSKKARLFILEQMKKAIAGPRPELSPYAPRILTLKIDQDKIGTVIGPGGKMINEIIAQTGTKIDIDDDGLVNITTLDPIKGQEALEWIRGLVRTAKTGDIFDGKVVKITDFGAFVEVLPGQDGLLHISEIADRRIEHVEDVLKVGQKILVKVKNVDDNGRISLTAKNVKS